MIAFSQDGIDFSSCYSTKVAEQCPALCGTDECYIPGKQTKCDLAPACNYHGSCMGAPSGIGQCLCETGYDPQDYCKSKIGKKI